MADLKRTKHRFSLPGGADTIIAARLETLGMTPQQYFASLVSYDCWAEKPHSLTGEACKDKGQEAKIWQEIIADFAKPNKTGSFFEHRLAEIAAARARGETL